MAYIKSRKHAAARSVPPLTATAAALLVLSAPVSAQTSGTLPEVHVESAAESYKPTQASSPKFTQPLVDTPQTITVIKKEVLQDQGATTLAEALRNTPGVTMLLGEGGNSNQKDNIFLRGFDTSGSIFIDGTRDLGNFPRDIYNTEQVEVIKGPSGSDYGRGSPSGTINLTTKVPLAENFVGGSVTLGTADTKRATLDLNRKLGETSAFRLNAMAQDKGTAGRDEVKTKGWGVAPSLAFGIGTATRTTLSYEHVDQDNRPDGGVPTVGLPGYYNAALANAGVTSIPRPDRDNFYGAYSDFEKVEGDSLTGRIEHDLAPGMTLRNTTRAAKVRHQLMLTAPTGVVSDTVGGVAVARLNPATWTATRSRQSKWQENTLFTNQTNLTSEFKTGGLAHSLSTGVELIYEKQLTKTLGGVGTMAPANLWAPNPADPITGYALAPTGAQSKGDSFTVGLYAFDTIKFNDQWQVTGGLRWDKYRVDNDTLAAPAGTPPTQTGTALTASDSILSGKIGVVYKPAANGSIYAAYATSQQPPGGSNFTLNATANNINNPNLEPQKATNVELGTKWDVLDNRLALTAAVYRSENKNDLTQADAVTGEVTQYGKKRVTGLELGLVGAITPAWAVSAGLAKMKTDVQQGTAAQNGASLNWSPELSFTAWTTYRLPFGVTIGGGARYLDSVVRSVSNTATAATTNMLGVPSYWVVDAMVSYEVTRNVSLQLNLYNLTDKFYIANLNNNGNRYTPGATRSALLTANVKF
ncbi:MAG: catecholate siderophore receptor Fiu [Pseudomonadota bacterium]